MWTIWIYYLEMTMEQLLLLPDLVYVRLCLSPLRIHSILGQRQCVCCSIVREKPKIDIGIHRWEQAHKLSTRSAGTTDCVRGLEEKFSVCSVGSPLGLMQERSSVEIYSDSPWVWNAQTHTKEPLIFLKVPNRPKCRGCIWPHTDFVQMLSSTFTVDCFLGS